MTAPIAPTNSRTPAEQPHLERRFNMLSATALNMTNMMGAGPFITIPLLMTALGGPQAMLGWLVALIIVICDGMVWSELGAAMPGSGGSFRYLRDSFGPARFGRLMGFLFVWQFILSGPLEIASGYIGFAQYAQYLWAGLTRTWVIVLVTVVGIINIALLYRRIQSIAKITISLWAGTLITVLAVILTGAFNFKPRIAFDFPPGAFNLSLGFFLGLGAATRIGIYDYLGYYDVCYIGDEVENPGRVIPRSILLSTVAVALIYVAVNFSIIGIVPWRDFVPAAAQRRRDPHPSLHRLRLHAEDLRRRRSDDLHAARPLDRVRIGVRAATRVFPDSLRGGREWILFPCLRSTASDEGFSLCIAAGARCALDRGGFLFPRHGD